MRYVYVFLVLAVTLAACDDGTPKQSPIPPIRPDVSVEPSAESKALSRYYAALQNDLLSRGLMRTDGGGPDTSFSADELARNFQKIAFNDEYVGPRTSGASLLARWEVPVRVGAAIGPSVDKDAAAKDKKILSDYARRLGRVTGHSVSPTTNNPNFLVLIAGEDDGDFITSRVRQHVPGIRTDQLAFFVNVPRSIYCLVVAFSGETTPNGYTRAVALVRAEHPDLTRQACIHEEVAQGLGLPNDSLQARPSIFNDDDEFALLTNHDELLLRMLYDPRMKPGMTEAQAAPVARILAREYLGLAL
ncbi:MAG: DUF2927 domain-containing protein [Paracoccaceae bacterium]